MDWQASLTVGLLIAMIVAMAREVTSPDVILLGGLFVLAGAGVLTPQETFAGFANESVATIGAVLILAEALRITGAMEATFGRIFGRTSNETVGLLRLMVPVAAASAFLNNTTIVAMMTPVVIDWARRNRMAASRFLMPMDFATILGGVVTIIGTSTNLTVAGLVTKAGLPPMGFFELTPLGLAVAGVGLVYLLVVAPRLLPAQQDVVESAEAHRREYTAAMLVEPGGPLAGSTIEEAGLRHLPGLFLVEIDRGGRVITPVAPDEVLRDNDRLVFAGAVATIVDLQRLRGLLPTSEGEEALPGRIGRRLTEAVISNTSPLVGQSIRDANFRTRFDAAVIAVNRNGERVTGKIGNIVLRPGDTLLLQTASGFFRAHRNSRDFYLVSEIPDTEPPRWDRARMAMTILVALVTVATLEWLPMSIAAFLAVGALLLTRCISLNAARRSVEWPMLLTIAAALGIGTAMEKTGVAKLAAAALTAETATWGPVAALAVIYVVTLILTEAISNNAAAALMFPVALSTAEQLGVDSRGFIMAICIAASCGFATPFGYQTHLIVYGPGGYRFNDFVRVGLPLDLVCTVVAVLVIPLLWPF